MDELSEKGKAFLKTENDARDRYSGKPPPHADARGGFNFHLPGSSQQRRSSPSSEAGESSSDSGNNQERHTDQEVGVHELFAAPEEEKKAAYAVHSTEGFKAAEYAADHHGYDSQFAGQTYQEHRGPLSVSRQGFPVVHPTHQAANAATDPGASVAPPDGGWAWLVVLFGAVAHMIVDGIIVSYAILMLELMKDFGSNGKAVVAGVGSLMVGISLVIGPLSAALVNRFGLRICAIGGALVGATGLFIASYGRHIGFMFVFYGVVAGVGMGVIVVCAVIAPSFYFEKRRALATGLSTCGSGIGMLVMPLIQQQLIQTVGWRWTLTINAGLVLLVIPFAFLIRPLNLINPLPIAESMLSLLSVHAETAAAIAAKGVATGPAGEPMATENKKGLAGDTNGEEEMSPMVPLTVGRKLPNVSAKQDGHAQGQEEFNNDETVGWCCNDPNNPFAISISTRVCPGHLDEEDKCLTLDAKGSLKTIFRRNSATGFHPDGNSIAPDARSTMGQQISTEPASILYSVYHHCSNEDPVAAEHVEKSVAASFYEKTPEASPSTLVEAIDQTTSPWVEEGEQLNKAGSPQFPAAENTRDIEKAEAPETITPFTVVEPKTIQLAADKKVIKRRSGWRSRKSAAVQTGMTRADAARCDSRRNMRMGEYIAKISEDPHDHGAQNQLLRVLISRYRAQNAGLSVSGVPSDDLTHITHIGSPVSRRLINPTHRDYSFISNVTNITNFSARISKPLFRKDIFYTGSIEKLDEYRKKGSMTAYRESIIAVPDVALKEMIQGEIRMDLGKDDPTLVAAPRTSVCCPASLTSALSNILRFSLFKQPAFRLFCLSGFFASLGFVIAPYYIPDMFMSKGHSISQGALALSVIGAFNTVGRVVCGAIADLPQTKPLPLFFVAVTCAGIMTGVAPLLTKSFVHMLPFFICFGLGLATAVALRSILLVKYLGLENLTSAFGIYLLFTGIATGIAPPLAGMLLSMTGDFMYVYIFSGAMTCLAAISLLPLYFIKPYCPENQNGGPS